MTAKESLVSSEHIQQSILLIRARKVMLDADLASLYGVRHLEVTDCDLKSELRTGTRPTIATGRALCAARALEEVDPQGV